MGAKFGGLKIRTLTMLLRGVKVERQMLLTVKCYVNHIIRLKGISKNHYTSGIEPLYLKLWLRCFKKLFS